MYIHLIVMTIHDEELRKAGIEITQFGLLTALAIVGEANQKALSTGFAMDSTTLTRTLALLRKQGWIYVRPGKDRRERVFGLTKAGKGQIACGKRLAQRLGSNCRRLSLESRARRSRRSVLLCHIDVYTHNRDRLSER